MSTSHGLGHTSSSSSRYGRGWVGGDQEPSPDPSDAYGVQPPPGDQSPPGDDYGQTPTEPEPEPEADPELEPGPEPETYGPDDPSYPEPEPEPGGDYGQAPKPPPPPPTKPPTHPCPPSMTCDTRRIDDLECEAKALKAESDEYSKDAEALKKRREDFEKARTAYTEERGKVEATQKKLGDKKLKDKIAKLLDETRCKLNKDERARIDTAFGRVLDCLKECPEDVGCCIDCGFASKRWTVDQMDGLLARVKKAEKCFDEVLVKEPEQLAKRVESLGQEVQELEDAKLDPKRMYAMAKRLDWFYQSIWGRFPDANKYQDCLCNGLQCSLRGRKLLAELAGQKAYQECREATRLARCNWLRTNIVNETLATYDVLPPAQSPGQAVAATTGADDA